MSAKNWNTWIFESSLPPDDAAAFALEYIAIGGNSSPIKCMDYFAFYSNLKAIFTALLSQILTK